MKAIVNRNSRGIAAALFMVGGALVGAAAMAWLIPVREHNFLDLRVGLAIGAFVGYVGFRIVAHLVNGRSKHE
jgi:hypothetical protein